MFVKIDKVSLSNFFKALAKRGSLSSEYLNLFGFMAEIKEAKKRNTQSEPNYSAPERIAQIRTIKTLK